MSNNLSPFQQKTAAKTIAENIRLKAELEDLDTVISKLFADAPPAVRDAVSKEEVENLVTAINDGTADNNKISRFLELANKLGLS